jgi:lactobin A/cerein 7B family class IIb bacteriocin
MKTIDLNNTKLFELNNQEMSENSGGIIPVLVVAGTIAFWGAAFYGAYMAGYNAAQTR